MSKLTAPQLDKIKSDILSKNAVVFLGPLATVNYGDKDRLDRKFRELAEKHSDLITAFHEKDRLLVFDRQKGGRGTLGREIADFYRQTAPNELLQVLVDIPFHIYITVTPDETLQRVFGTQYPYCEDFLYRKPPIDQYPDEKRPLIYNLMGSVRDENSLVLSHGGLFTMINQLQKNEALPQAIVNATTPDGDNKKSLIFLGFEFDKWYYQLLMFLLKFDKGLQPIAAGEKPEDEGELAPYIANFELTFVDDDLLEVAKDIRATIPKSQWRPTLILRPGRFRDFFLDRMEETDFLWLCEQHFPQVRQRFNDGQDQRLRVKWLLDFVEAQDSWDRLGEMLRPLNPKVYDQIFATDEH